MDFGAVFLFGIIAGVLQFAGYATYFYDVVRSGVRPNPASWLIWSYGNALVCLSYVFLNDNLSIAADILPIVCASACILMTISFFFLGKFRSLDIFEKIIVYLDIAVTLVWVLSDFFGMNLVSLRFLHTVLLLSATASFLPLYREVIRDQMAEKPRSWIIWTTAYIFLVMVIVFEKGGFEALSYPVMYAVLHIIVVLLSSRRTRKVLRLKIS